MSFTRIKYDNDAYNLKLNRETGPGDYRLFMPNNESCNKCSSYDGTRNSKSDVAIRGSTTTNQWGPMAEIESALTNRVNKLIDSNEYGSNDNYKTLSTDIPINCSTFLDSEDTRFSNPLEAYRCMDLTSYHYSPFLHVSNQCEIQEDRIGLNSRLKVKDSFKVSVPNIVDQEAVLPPNKDNNLGNDTHDLCMNF